MVRLFRQEVHVVVLGCYYHFPKWYYQFQKSGSKFGRDGPTTRDGRVLGIFLTPMMLSAAVRRRDWSSAAANAAPIVLQLGDARLRRRCQKCDLKDAATLAIERDLHAALEDFRLRNGYGRAISAPQIGHAVRMVACNLGSSAIHRPGKQPFTLVNPEITWRSKETFTMWDDCMSFPDQMVKLRRHTHISVAYLTPEGEPHNWTNLGQAESELLQHELDPFRRDSCGRPRRGDRCPGRIPRAARIL